VPNDNAEHSNAAWATWGAMLRHYRSAAEMTQGELGGPTNYSISQISALERGVRRPSRKFAREADKILNTGGALTVLLGQLDSEPYPDWFEEWAKECEPNATVLRNWQPLVVPGLLQTESYARAIFSGCRPDASEDEIDELVAARLARQAIVERSEPPVLHFVMAECVLTQLVGSRETMRGQLDAIVAATAHRRITVQVVPASTGSHPGLMGAFAIASFASGPDVAYMDSQRDGHVTDRPEVVTSIVRSWEVINMEALPPSASIELIKRMREKLWT
jgi:transcriptional regulator with XRE-family HTH domain